MGKVFNIFLNSLVTLLLVCSVSVNAQQLDVPKYGPGGESEIKVLGDHVLIPITIKSEGMTKDSHIMVDYAFPHVFGVHKSVMDSLNGGLWGKNETTLKFKSDSVFFEIPRDELLTIQPGQMAIDGLTARYDIELENIDIAAVIGAYTLKHYQLKLNIENKSISILPSTQKAADELRGTSQVFIDGVTQHGGYTYVPVSIGDERKGTIEFHTATYHTTINPDVKASMPEGTEIFLGEGDITENISSMVAIRTKQLPAPFEYEDQETKEKIVEVVGPDRIMRSGIGLWTSYEVTIDPKQGYLALNRTRNNNYSDADVAFYAASFKESWDELKSYLETYPTDRNVEEAVGEIFTIGLKEKRSHTDLLWSLDQSLAQMRERRKSNYVLDFCFQSHNQQPKEDYHTSTIEVCKSALAYIGRSQSPGNRQLLQLVLGERHLDIDKNQDGWKYYLAASFNGSPEPNFEIPTRLGLSRAYEKLGRYRRAYATLLRIKEIPKLRERGGLEAIAQAMEQTGANASLDRLEKHLDPNDPLLEKR